MVGNVRNSPKAAGKGPLNVLVVDDSAVVRQVMTAVLSQEKDMAVITAADPLIAMTKMERQQRPDVILLDLEMPRMDGLTFLRKIMAEDPIPVVICSGIAERGTDAAFAALEAGAIEILTKPQIGVRDFLYESAVVLTDTVRAAAKARLRPRVTPLPTHERRTADAVLPSRESSPLKITTDKVVAIGASTGGTETLRVLLEAMPADAPGLVIVQHMPEHFTAAFARRLDRTCAIDVKEAENGDRIINGRALIARGNHHLLVHRSGAHYTVEVTEGSLVSRHRPSVDVLFRSVAQAAGPNAVGVIMTGMGDDGAEGLLEMKREGATTLAQDESSCVVFGMPKEAIARGAADEVLPLTHIAGAVLRKISRPKKLPDHQHAKA
jgi:two-component system chemotaxis response regulator CheB